MADNYIPPDCSERMCSRSADYTLCDKHYEAEMETARDAATEKARDAVEKVMDRWESITDADNPATIEDIKRELLDAI